MGSRSNLIGAARESAPAFERDFSNLVTQNDTIELEGPAGWTSGSVALPYVGLQNSSGTLMSVGGNYTLVAASHHGKTIVCTAAATITLPAVGVGHCYTIVNGVGGVLVSVSPDSSDKFLFDIAGAAGTDDKDIQNTGATAKAGDFVHLIGLAAAGWGIINRSGTWVDES